jgi:hypothetical protein
MTAIVAFGSAPRFSCPAYWRIIFRHEIWLSERLGGTNILIYLAVIKMPGKFTAGPGELTIP